jgi:hypothetical protein
MAEVTTPLLSSNSKVSTTQIQTIECMQHLQLLSDAERTADLERLLGKHKFRDSVKALGNDLVASGFNATPKLIAIFSMVRTLVLEREAELREAERIRVAADAKAEQDRINASATTEMSRFAVALKKMEDDLAERGSSAQSKTHEELLRSNDTAAKSATVEEKARTEDSRPRKVSLKLHRITVGPTHCLTQIFLSTATCIKCAAGAISVPFP